IELESISVDLRRQALAEIGVVPKILDRLALRVGRHHPVEIEDRSLGAVVPTGDAVEHALHGARIGDVAAGEQRQCAETEALLEKQSALDLSRRRARPQKLLGLAVV